MPVAPDTPPWLLACGGLTLVFIGGAVILGFAVAGRPGPDGSPPVFAPFGLQLAQYLTGLGIVSTMTAAFTFVAFGPGERHFSGSSSFLFWSQQGGGGEMAGRVAFGSGAVLMWIYLIAVGVSGARHLVREFRKR